MNIEDEETANDPTPLHSELVIEILTRVPPKPVSQFKCVSKEWLDLINNQSFIKRHAIIQANSSSGTLIIHHANTLYTIDFHDPHFQATKLDFPENMNFLLSGLFRVVGSCNGLLCIEFRNQIALYNPTTKAHKIISQFDPREKVLGKDDKPRYAFAYDSISDDYKILRFEKENRRRRMRTHLYTLSTNSWERIENPDWDQDSVQYPGVVANNTLYWMETNHLNIKCFDLFSRRFSEMPLPENISPDYSPRLAVLRGRLHIVTYYFHIWKLENCEEQEFSWTRVFRCSSSQWNHIYQLSYNGYSWRTGSLACSKDGRKILVARFSGPLNFISCDIESQETTIIKEVQGLSPTWKAYSSMLPWAGTLVPLSN